MLSRNMLVDYDTEEPMIFGHRFKYFGVSWKYKNYTFHYSLYFHSSVKTVGLISARATWLGVLAMFYPKQHSAHLLKVSFWIDHWFELLTVDCVRQRWKILRSVLTRALSGVERTSEWVGIICWSMMIQLTIAGQCMTKLNVTVGDSRDSGGRAR